MMCHAERKRLLHIGWGENICKFKHIYLFNKCSYQLTVMAYFTLRYYNQVKDYLHPRLHKFINYYKHENTFDLPLFHGCHRKNRNGTRKLIEYNQGYNALFQLTNLIRKKLKINTNMA